MLETLLREMDEEGGADDGGETVVHDNDQARKAKRKTHHIDRHVHTSQQYLFSVVLCAIVVCNKMPNDVFVEIES